MSDDTSFGKTGRYYLTLLLTVVTFGAGGVLQSGCFGSFQLTTKLYEVNQNVSGNKFVRWLVFLGLSIFPVYEGAILVDALILNTIEFWGGGAGLSSEGAEPGERRTVSLEHGRELHMVRLEQGVRTRIARDGEIVSELTFRLRDGELVALDGDGTLLGLAREVAEGVEVISSGGRRSIFESHPILESLYGPSPNMRSTQRRSSHTELP